MREKGTVKFYNAERGYGFLRRIGSPDLFFHIRHFISDEPATIERGTVLAFIATTGRDGRLLADQIEVWNDGEA